MQTKGQTTQLVMMATEDFY